jgi:hypothetical protein
MLKDKKVLIAIAVIILLLAGGSYYFLGMQKPKPVEQVEDVDEFAVEELSPADIGLDFVFRNDGKAGKIIIGKPKGIKAMEYQLSYQKNQEGEDVPEGLIGEIDLTKIVDGKVETEFREFGTCSSGKCRYDTVTTPIKVTLKITKDDGKVYQSEKSFELPE